MLAKRFRKLTVLAVTAALSAASVVSNATAADTVVQVNVDSVIDGRTVFTVANGTVTVWNVGASGDGDGDADGVVTHAVEGILATQRKTVGLKVSVALHDDGKF